MVYDFDTTVDRSGLGSLKQIICPRHILDAGIPSYSGAEMEFKTAPSAMQAVIRRAQAGLPSYTLCDKPYRDAVKWWMQTQRGLNIQDDWIIPTHGTIFSLATLIRMATEAGDAIIIQPPTYNRYEQAARRLDRKTLHNRLLCENGSYRMDFAGLESLMSRPDTKILVICNPQNPTGNVWSLGELAEVSRMAQKYGVLVFCDEIFAEVSFGGQCPSYLSVPGATPHAVVATSLGKCFSFTGVNHANVLIADTELNARFKKQRDADHYGSIDPWVYSSVLGAYNPEGAAWKDAMVAYVKSNIAYLRDFIARHIPAIKIYPCAGSYVLWLDFGGLGLNTDELKGFLENEALLHLSPGEEYYGDKPGLYRMCAAVPRKELERSAKLLLEAAQAHCFTTGGLI